MDCYFYVYDFSGRGDSENASWLNRSASLKSERESFGSESTASVSTGRRWNEKYESGRPGRERAEGTGEAHQGAA